MSKSRFPFISVTIILFFIFILILRIFAVDYFSMPSGSMQPTLLVGNHLIVSKYPYGYSRHSLHSLEPLIPASFNGRLFGSAPERGDVIVFRNQRDGGAYYVKRVIGLPGDRVQMSGGVLVIDGEAAPRERVDDFVLDRGGVQRAVARYAETLPDGASYEILEMLSDKGALDDTSPYVVPPGHVFVLGDNRDGSADSRVAGVGFVPLETLVGRLEFVLR